MTEEWLSPNEERERSLRKFFIAIKTKEGWTTIFFKIKDVAEIQNHLETNRNNILDHSSPWEPLVN